MPSCIFDTCCGCIELRTGCIIIGYLNLVGIIIFIPIVSMGLMIGGGLIASDDDAKVHEAGIFIVIMCLITLILLLVMFLFTMVFLIGIYKNKRKYVQAYIALSAVSLAYATILIPFQEFVVEDMVGKIISYLVSFYFLLVIRSYYYTMDDIKRPNIDT